MMIFVIIIITTATTRATTTTTTTSVTSTWRRDAFLRTGMVTRKKPGRIPEGNPEGLLSLALI
eukprot:6027893-Karenia_brevis.AAC.1